MTVKTPSTDTLRRLRKSRPRNRLVTASVLGFCGLVAYAWWSVLRQGSASSFDTRLENLKRFLTRDARPYDESSRSPVDSFAGLCDWAWSLLTHGEGFEAAARTLGIAVVAAVLAGAVGAVLALPAARTLATPDPFGAPGSARRSGFLQSTSWYMLHCATRCTLILLRGVPEYVWAFFFLELLRTHDPAHGVSAWPAVFALAVHNAGILGKLGSETIENASVSPPRALTTIGASRKQTSMHALAPALFPRLLLYFFYRWETCVREATVLGILGAATLGYLINEARAKTAYDQLLFFTLLGALLVIAGDAVSDLVRKRVRDAS